MGREGKASARGNGRFWLLPVLETGGVGRAEAGADCSHEGVGAGEARDEAPPMRAAMAEAEFLLEEAEAGGKMEPLGAEPHEPLRETAEREDCWVEDLSLSTLLAPIAWPRTLAAVLAEEEEPVARVGPGKDG